MPAFTSFAEAQAELVATSDYDVELDVAKAKRFVAAARALQTFTAMSGSEGQSMQFDMQRIGALMNQALAWLAANNVQTDAQRLNNPSVTHADFSDFGPYSPGGCS